MKPSAEELKAAAESAIQARQKANDAKEAAEEAGGVDEALNQASQQAESEAVAAESKAKALSQPSNDPEKRKEKLLRKKHFINQELRTLGVDDEDDDDEDEQDPDKPVTARELSQRTVQELLAGVTDADERVSIQTALDTKINPSLIVSNPREAFSTARAIANTAKNSKIIEEHNRKSGFTSRAHGAGSPPKAPAENEPLTTEERAYLRPPFSLSEADIIAARR